MYGREEGIRTLEGLHLTRVPGVLLQPLGHLSKNVIITCFYHLGIYTPKHILILILPF